MWMRLAPVVISLALLGGCASATKSSLVVEKRRELAHNQLTVNLGRVAEANITGREREGFGRLLAETKLAILSVSSKQGGKLSAGFVLGTLEAFQANVRKLMATINVERELLGRVRLQDAVYKQLSAQIYEYLSQLGKISAGDLQQLSAGLSEGSAGLIKDIDAAREAKYKEALRQAQIEAALRTAEEREEETE